MKAWAKLGLLVALVAVSWWFFSGKSEKPASVARKPAPAADAAAPAAEPMSSELETGLPQARARDKKRGERAEAGQYKTEFEQVDSLLRAGNAQEAKRILEGILARDPNHERALEEMGMLYLTELQDPDQAAAFFQKALAANPNNEFAVMELVGISLQPEKAGAAAEYLKRLHDANPNSAVLADGLAELYLTQGRYNEAVGYLEKSAQDPRYAEFSYNRLASVHEQMGDTDKAAEYYRAALNQQKGEIERRRGQGHSTDLIEADMARTELDLAHLLVRQGRFEDAREHLERARERLGNDWEVQALADTIRQNGG